MKLNHILFLVFAFTLFTFTACKENKATEESQKESTTEIKDLSSEEIQHYSEIGKSIAKATFTELSGNLKQALKTGGVKEASEYCNIVAMPLVDSLSTVHNAKIKRTSLKLRNSENKATPKEMMVLNEYEKLISKQTALKPIVKANDAESVQFYAPIMTKQLCLSCHGTVGQELTKENYTILKDLYPADKAIGYSENAFRGMWSIELKR